MYTHPIAQLLRSVTTIFRAGRRSIPAVRFSRLGIIASTLFLFGAYRYAYAAPIVLNGDFEADTDGFVVWPGYVSPQTPENPSSITGWTGEGDLRGINPIADGSAPFRDNGGNETHVAFLQGVGFIEQLISGFDVGSGYVLGVDLNSRDCCGDFPVGTILLNGDIVASTTELPFPNGALPPVGGLEPWYHVNVPFVAMTDHITLRIATAASVLNGDATLLVDNVAIVPEPGTETLLLLALTTCAAWPGGYDTAGNKCQMGVPRVTRDGRKRHFKLAATTRHAPSVQNLNTGVSFSAPPERIIERRALRTWVESVEGAPKSAALSTTHRRIVAIQT